MLYGTELADPEDVRWWQKQRTGAPLDREVDPWGSSKLRDHLNKMWYGYSTEELQARHEQLERERRLDEAAASAYGLGHAPREVLLCYEPQPGRHGPAEPQPALRSPLRADRVACRLPEPSKAVSLSPRREARWLREPPRAQVLGAPPPAVPYQSPPQTHRAARPVLRGPGSPCRMAQESAARRWAGSRPSLPAPAASWGLQHSCTASTSLLRARPLRA